MSSVNRLNTAPKSTPYESASMSALRATQALTEVALIPLRDYAMFWTNDLSQLLEIDHTSKSAMHVCANRQHVKAFAICILDGSNIIAHLLHLA
jgi:hypothetical protein